MTDLVVFGRLKCVSLLTFVHNQSLWLACLGGFSGRLGFIAWRSTPRWTTSTQMFILTTKDCSPISACAVDFMYVVRLGGAGLNLNSQEFICFQPLHLCLVNVKIFDMPSGVC